jgi:multidrug efflux pump
MNVAEPFIKRPVATTLLTIGIALAGAVAFKALPVSPLPQIDFPTIRVQAGLPGASPEIMASSIATPLERQLGRIAAITEMTSSNSIGSTSITIQFDLNRNIDGAARDVQAAINAARSWLKPLNRRKLTSSQVIDRLRPKFNNLVGAKVILQAGQDLRIGARQSNAQYQYTIQSDSVNDLVKWGPILFAQMKKLSMLTDVDTDQQNGGLEAYLTYDRDTAARMGITPQLIDHPLYRAFGQALVSTMYTPLNQYYVLMEVAPQYWQDPRSLNDIYIHATTGGEVPLSAVTHYQPTTAALAVNHQGQFPSVTVSFNLAPGVALSQASAAITQMEERIGMPDTIHAMFSGTLQAYQESLATEPLLIATAIFAVYIVLGILYESVIHPITILSTLPSAGVGAVLALFAFRTDLDIIAIIGMVLLIGIVKKNAILMIDFALAAERNEGKTSKDAIYQACLLRFRPILMTTMAALLSALPLALGTGVGSELRRPLGSTIVGGLIFSQMLTLYTTPVVYLYMDRLSLWRQRSRRKQMTASRWVPTEP